MSGKNNRNKLRREEAARRANAGDPAVTQTVSKTEHDAQIAELFRKLRGKEGWPAMLKHKDAATPSEGIYLGLARLPRGPNREYLHFASGRNYPQVFAAVDDHSLRVGWGAGTLEVVYTAHFRYYGFPADHPLYPTLLRYQNGELPMRSSQPVQSSPKRTLGDRVLGIFREMSKPENWI